MKTFVTISVLDDNTDLGEAINRVLQTHVDTEVYVYDLTQKGLGKEMKRLIKSYNSFKVFHVRLKRCEKITCRNERTNLGIAESLMKFQAMKSKGFDTYVHIKQGMIFNPGELKTLVENGVHYHGLSPVIESIKGIEVLKGFFDRYAFEVADLEEASMHFITGKVEESFALNPKCFVLSNVCARRITHFTHSQRSPEIYLNELVFNYTNINARVDTNTFVHEHLY